MEGRRLGDVIEGRFRTERASGLKEREVTSQ